MKVSLLNLNLVVEDAIGQCMINQARFFRRRGDDVQIYVLHPPQHVPADVADLIRGATLGTLIGGQQEHFDRSDLYIYHYPGRYALVESIRGIEKGTVIFYYHNVTPPELWGSEADRALLLQGLEGSALAHYADLCITPSPFNKRDLVERVGCEADRVRVLPLAVPLQHFTPGEPDPELTRRLGLEGQRVLLFAGRMAGNKRIDLLIQALARVKRQVPNTRLLLVGDDSSAPAFRQIVASAQTLASELGVAADVVWTGRVDDQVPYFRLADVYVTASLHEGFGVPLIEAMACGVPVVASRAGAMPWVLGDAGLTCEPGDANDLADKVLALLQGNDLRQALIERGRERVQAFSLEQYEAGLAEILEQAMLYAPSHARSAVREDVALEERVSRDELFLYALAEELETNSDIALRDYRVRSRAPLVGPLIVRARRNLTSHLREPYLDPMIERQVALNRRIAEWLKWAAQDLAACRRSQAELETRIAALENWLFTRSDRSERNRLEE